MRDLLLVTITVGQIGSGTLSPRLLSYARSLVSVVSITRAMDVPPRVTLIRLGSRELDSLEQQTRSARDRKSVV